MSVIIIPRRHYTQPQGRVLVNADVWGARSQIFLPSLGHSGVIGGVETISVPSANKPFSKVGPLGIEHTWRPNTSTLPGESHGWAAGNFDVGPDASMIFVGYSVESYWAGIAYGGTAWGLWLGFNTTSALGAYVDSPTSASRAATLNGGGRPNGAIHAVGLVKRGATVRVFADRHIATTSGGNGGIRRSAGSGLFGPGGGIDGRHVYAATMLSAVSSSALSDEQMFAVLDNPWSIFRDDPVRIYSLPSGPISLTINSITASNITQTGARITLGLTR